MQQERKQEHNKNANKNANRHTNKNANNRIKHEPETNYKEKELDRIELVVGSSGLGIIKKGG